MPKDKITQLIEALHEGTARGTVEWEKPKDKDIYTYRSSSGTVRLTTRDDDGLFPYYLSVFNTSGDLIEFHSEEGPGGTLGLLFRLVREQTLKISETLDALIREAQDERF